MTHIDGVLDLVVEWRCEQGVSWKVVVILGPHGKWRGPLINTSQSMMASMRPE